MERLTKWSEETEGAELKDYDSDEWKEFFSYWDFVDECMFKMAIDKLAEYEDLEEQGLLHKAPLKDGTPIFVIRTDWEDGDEVCEDGYLYGVTEYMVGEINKNYWLTKEEAEQALERMAKENG